MSMDSHVSAEPLSTGSTSTMSCAKKMHSALPHTCHLASDLPDNFQSVR